jgi:cell division protein FtsA
MKREKIICGLDIGSAKILAAIAKVSRQGKVDLLASQILESRGINRGSVSDLANLSDCLAQARQSLFKKSGLKPQEVFVGIKGTCFKTKTSKTVIPLLDRGDKVITSSDIKKLNHQARALGIDIEEEVIHEIPQSYTIDDYNVVKNPLGLYARKVGVELLLVTSPMGHIDNLVKSLNQVGWGVKRVIFSSLAASYGVLSEEEKERGCVFIDMGAGTTDILVFKDGILRELEILPYGGMDFTESIANDLKLTFDLAEEIKRSYAVATSSEAEGEEDILIKKSSSYNPIKRKKLVEVIEPNISHLLKLVKERLDRSAFRKYFNSGVVVTGGNSLLYGFLEQAESFLGLPVKMGRVKDFSLSYYKIPVYASVLGLIKFAASGLASDSAARLSHRKLVKGLTSRIKELYQEYF